MRRVFRAVAVLALFVGTLMWWRRNRRFGTAFVNRVVNPALMRRGWSGSGRSEIGTLEHIGRRSGTRRLTPVHPEPTADGFRIIVPLADESQWARNVLAAGHCRLCLHGTVYELDEPRLIDPAEVEALPRGLRKVESLLGFRYLTLHTFAAASGELEAPVQDVREATPGPRPTEEPAPHGLRSTPAVSRSTPGCRSGRAAGGRRSRRRSTSIP
jgi:hypothetical protein